MTVFNMEDRFIINGLQLAMILNAFNSIDELFQDEKTIGKNETVFGTEREIIEKVLTKKVAA